MSEHTPLTDAECESLDSILVALWQAETERGYCRPLAATADTDEAEAEAHDLAHDLDRCEERLWRLAAKAGWRPGNPADNNATAEAYIADALDAATADTGLRERVEAIETHNGTPITPENLRWAATHEALCRSWIFNVLTGLADALDATAAPTTDTGARDE